MLGLVPREPHGGQFIAKDGQVPKPDMYAAECEVFSLGVENQEAELIALNARQVGNRL